MKRKTSAATLSHERSFTRWVASVCSTAQILECADEQITEELPAVRPETLEVWKCRRRR
jgi:hypothetical protein